MKKKTGMALLLSLILVLLLGYGAASRIADPVDEKTRSPLKFGATYMTMNNPYFVVLNDSIKEVIEANGDILITRDPAQDQDRQNQQIQEMIDEGVEVIFVNPVDWERVTPALKACREAGVVVINVDTAVKDKQYVETVIQSDNYNAGIQCARDMMSKKASAKILILEHYDIRSTMERVKGFKDTIANFPQYQIVKEMNTKPELETAMAAMNTILTQQTDFDVVLGGNDPTALGALAALQLNHVDRDVMVYGIDGSPEAKAMIEQGLLEATSAQRPMEMGRMAAKAAYSHLDGGNLDREILIDVTLITEENLKEFDVDGWQ